MRQALIGYTGFVGSNLMRDAAFGDVYHSGNIRSMRGQHFDRIVCAGLPAAKWQINQNPEKDLANIALLQSVLDEVTADRFWLVSTVDVYPDVTAGFDEDHDPHIGNNHAYGRHRLQFEDYIRGRFSHHLIARLPGLYGMGLKKNIIFDLLHDNCLEMINPDSQFQWYDVGRLWRDLVIADRHDIPVINLMTEPLRTGNILDRCFPNSIVGTNPSPRARYDVHTRHAALFGGTGRYIDNADAVCDSIVHFVQLVQSAKAAGIIT